MLGQIDIVVFILSESVRSSRWLKRHDHDWGLVFFLVVLHMCCGAERVFGGGGRGSVLYMS